MRELSPQALGGSFVIDAHGWCSASGTVLEAELPGVGAALFGEGMTA